MNARIATNGIFSCDSVCLERWTVRFQIFHFFHNRVHSRSKYDLNFDLEVKFIGFNYTMRPWPLTSKSNIGFCNVFMSDLLLLFAFDIGILYLAHGAIKMRGCVKYIHDHDMTLTFDPKVKFRGFMTWLCVQASAFFSHWHSHTLAWSV